MEASKMIKIVYGPKGFGKTKIMIDEVNNAAKTASGNVVFISDKRFSTVVIDFNVRCVYTEEHGIKTTQAFIGFINGLLAGNSDIEYIFVDGLKRIIGNEMAGGEELFNAIELLQKEYPDLKFVISISAEKKDLPKYVLPYIS